MGLDSGDGWRRQVRPPRLAVRQLSGRATRGLLAAGGRTWPCAIGRSGRRALKREGDGATPTGAFILIEVLYRADRTLPPATSLPCRPIGPHDGWCDAVGDRNYNRRVRHPYPASAERLWREDHLYDLVVVLACNVQPRVQGRGSAIFMHLARAGYAPTEGCIALSERDLRQMLAGARQGGAVVVG